MSCLQLCVPELSEPPLTYNVPQSNMIDGIGDVDLYSFQGTVGDTANFRVTEDSGNADADAVRDLV